MRRDSGFTFSQVPRADIPRSVFPRNHTHKTTFDAGYLVPFYLDEVLPGDTFNVRANLFGRLATPIVPVMDNLFMDVFFFFVPNRLVWANWQKFCGEQENPGDSTDFTIPQWISPATTGWSNADLAVYLGLPAGVPGLSVSQLPFRGYRLIFYEWFRDENLVTASKPPVDDAPFTGGWGLYRRGKRHDYFTSCLPWPQKGPGVAMPLGATAPIVPDPRGGGYAEMYLRGTGTPGGTPGFVSSTAATAPSGVSWQNPATSVPAGTHLMWAANPNDAGGVGLLADLSQASSATINSLREAFQLQKMLERDARGGTRYVELLKSHFGVTVPDARLQRPEFLGGASLPIQIHPVMQTSGTATDTATGYSPTPQGSLAAYGTVGGNCGFTKSFVEHGYVYGLVSVRADLTYQQGVNRMWSRKVREEFYWPALAHLGEQAVLQKEIYATGVPANDDTVFGYQERWAEYRYHPSIISGKFLSSDPQTLHVWHLAQQFSAPPVLNDQFIQEDPPVDRIIAVPDEPHILFDSYVMARTARPMPLYSVPGYIDHF